MAFKIQHKIQHFAVTSKDLNVFLLATDSKGISLTLHIVSGPNWNGQSIDTFVFAKAGLGLNFTAIKDLIFFETNTKAVFYSSDFVGEISF